MEEHGEARGSKDTGAVRSSGLGRPDWPSAQDKGDDRGGFWIGEDGGWLVGDGSRGEFGGVAAAAEDLMDGLGVYLLYIVGRNWVRLYHPSDRNRTVKNKMLWETKQIIADVFRVFW